MGEVANLVTGVTGGIKQLFVPNMPEVPQPSAPASPATTAVQQAASEAAQRRSRARGYRSTLLSQNFLSQDNPALKQTYGS